MCSCISVTPRSVTGIGPSTVMTMPDPDMGGGKLAHVFLRFGPRRTANILVLSQMATRMIAPVTI